MLNDIRYVTLTCAECDKDYEARDYQKYRSKTCSIECRSIYRKKHRSKIMSGSKHPNWKGGKSKRTWTSEKIIKKLKELRGECEECAGKDNLHGHHKLSYSQHPELREDPDNIQILCVDCHGLKHPELDGMLFMAKNKTGTVLQCNECSEMYYVPKCLVKTSKTCSQECALKYLHKNFKPIKKGMHLNCTECSAEFYVKASKANKRKTCSRACGDKYHAKAMILSYAKRKVA